MQIFDYIVPLGADCHVTLALKEMGLRKCTFPFDWILSQKPQEYQAMLQLMAKRFKGYTSYRKDWTTRKRDRAHAQFKQWLEQRKRGVRTDGFSPVFVYHREYKLEYPHMQAECFLTGDLDKCWEKCKAEIDRRTMRLVEVMESAGRILFVRANVAVVSEQKMFNQIMSDSYPGANYEIIYSSDINALKTRLKSVKLRETAVIRSI